MRVGKTKDFDRIGQRTGNRFVDEHGFASGKHRTHFVEMLAAIPTEQQHHIDFC